QTTVPSFDRAAEGEPTPTATDTPGSLCARTAARTSSRARSPPAAYRADGAVPTTEGTVWACGNRGAATATACVRNAANVATTAPTASAVRAAQVGSRLRATCTPSTTPTISSSKPMAAAPGASSAAAT